MFGAIKRIVLPQDAHQIGSNRGFTFITFASKEPVEVACSLGNFFLKFLFFLDIFDFLLKTKINQNLRWHIASRTINQGGTQDKYDG